MLPVMLSPVCEPVTVLPLWVIVSEPAVLMSNPPWMVAVPAAQGVVAGVREKKFQRRRFNVAVAKDHVGFASHEAAGEFYLPCLDGGRRRSNFNSSFSSRSVSFSMSCRWVVCQQLD